MFFLFFTDNLEFCLQEKVERFSDAIDRYDVFLNQENQAVSYPPYVGEIFIPVDTVNDKILLTDRCYQISFLKKTPKHVIKFTSICGLKKIKIPIVIYNGLCKFNYVVLLKIIFQNLCQSTDFVEDLFLLMSTKFIVQHAFTVFYDIDTNKSIRTTT